MNWHPVYWGFCVQFLFAGIILRTRAGYETFDWLGDRVTEFLNFASEGAMFVFGESYREHLFAFGVSYTVFVVTSNLFIISSL